MGLDYASLIASSKPWNLTNFAVEIGGGGSWLPGSTGNWSGHLSEAAGAEAQGGADGGTIREGLDFEGVFDHVNDFVGEEDHADAEEGLELAS